MKHWGVRNPNLPNITVVGQPVTLLAFHNGPIAAPKLFYRERPPPVEGPYIPPAEPAVPPPPPASKLGTLWGIITDCATGRPIDGATAYLDGRVDHTGPTGKYEYPDVVPGNYSLYVVG